MPRKSKKSAAQLGQEQRDRMALRARAHTAAVSCIGTIPMVSDPARREACRLNLLLFLTTYFPESTGLSPFGEDQNRAISRIGTCIIDGGRFVEAFPRGYAKTTILELAVVWALLYGHRKFTPLFGANEKTATASMDSIKSEFEENDLLLADFPEICFSIKAIDGKPQRGNSQNHKPGDVEGGNPSDDVDPRRTHIEWRSDALVLPSCLVPDGWWTIEGAKPGAPLVEPPGAGGIVITCGLLAASRGMKHKRTSGANQRPDFVFIDDPQKDEQAESPAQVSKLLSILKKSVLKMGGHKNPMAVCCAGTIIQPDDFMDQLLTPRLNPSWQSERIAMVRTWGPAKDTLWLTDYAKIRNSFDPEKIGDQSRAHADAMAFYLAHKKEMDAGHEMAWDFCYFEHIEVSAIQHAYNMLIDDGPDVFASECQNRPKPRIESVSLAPRPIAIASKANNVPRGIILRSHSTLTAFIDVQKAVLPWVVMSFGQGFGGHVVDYGLFPAQSRPYVNISDVKITLQQQFQTPVLETSLMGGMEKLVDVLAHRVFMSEVGTEMRLNLIGIDENWGDSTGLVHTFCQRSKHANIVIPQDGRFYGPQARPIDTYQLKEGERGGYGWLLTKIRNSRHVVCDVNVWKTFAQRRLALPANAPGGWSLFGRSEEHEAFSHQVAAEYPDDHTSRGTGRTVTLWQKLPGRENHGLDLVVGAAVMASTLGVKASLEMSPRRSSVRQQRRKSVSYMF